jgi:hypothetical protein|nr:MAG TPA: hypothetical protein [Caudoviricetes sp.]
MAKITELPAAGPLTGAETMPVVQDGETKQAEFSEVLAAIGAEGDVQVARVTAEGGVQVDLARAERLLAESASNSAQSYASTAGSASVSNLFSILSQVTSNPPTTASVIQSNGCTIANSAPVDISLGQVKVVRQGFRNAVPTVFVETMYRTKRWRKAYPDQASFTDSPPLESLSDYVYSTDFVLGLINQSAEISPKPTANWVMPHRLLVNGTVHWEIVAFHRNASNRGAGGVGQQVDCVRVRANNGTTATAWQTVSGTSISTYVEDANPVEVFQGDLDISGLADGRFWLEAEVYPWIGAAASVLKSEDNYAASAGNREFTRRWFKKSSTVNYVYVASTGNNTTGAVSTNAATAAASPCLTVGGALERARTVLGSGTTGALDGLRIRIVDSVGMGNPYSALRPFRQDVAGVVIERAPGTARASAIVNGSAFFRPYFENHTSPITEGSLIFYDVSVNYTGAFTFTGEAANNLDVQFWNCSVNFGGFASTSRNNSHLSFYGVQVTNPHSTTFAFSGAGQIRAMRGITGDLNGGAWEGFLNVGNALTRPGAVAFSDASKPWICYANKLLNFQATLALHWRGSVSGGNLGPCAIVQNLTERCITADGGSIGLSRDSDFGNNTHSVIHHNTCVGAGNYGRCNVAYDEHPTVARTHKFISWKGNLIPQINVKGDDYSTILNGSRIGHFPVEHGVGFEGNFTMAVDAGGGTTGQESFRQSYAGLSTTINGGDPLWTNNQGVTITGPAPSSTATAGAGGGTYTLQAGSPARNLLPYPVLKYDIAGNLRGTGAQNAGAYQ